MEPIEGIDLGKLDEGATAAYKKLIQARVSDYLRGMLVQAHNLTMKGDRLRREADQSDAQLKVLREKITKMKAGDWSVIEPFELTDKAPASDPKEAK